MTNISKEMEELMKTSTLNLWQNYCDKKMECSVMTEILKEVDTELERMYDFPDEVDYSKLVVLRVKINEVIND
ncbi:hypothetical protein NVP1170O_158 [Vibrio phage 1.170.O._10N.261.52.C3]|nr:hypothetical protein NVP1170O_158 [Vibrio phage 1.170.O._10N.261.52.C3]